MTRAASVTVHYARHGENRANITRELSHRVVDHPLTERGIDQARTLAQTNRTRQIFSSPLRRAVQTAELVAEVGGHSVQIIENLRELNVGELDGRRDTEAWTAYRAVLTAWRRGDHDVAFPGGENYHELVARLRGAFEQIATRTGGPALVVAHGGGLRAAVPALSPGIPEPDHDLDNCATAEFTVSRAESPTRITLVSWPGPSRRRTAG